LRLPQSRNQQLQSKRLNLLKLPLSRKQLLKSNLRKKVKKLSQLSIMQLCKTFWKKLQRILPQKIHLNLLMKRRLKNLLLKK